MNLLAMNLLAMNLLAMNLLAGCAPSPLLESVEARLASEAVEDAEPAVRLYTGISGVIAETFAVDSIEAYAFSGESAVALGVSLATVTTGNDILTWEFADVGLDGARGRLVVVTDLNRASFAVSYGDVFVATLTKLLDEDDRAIVGGSGTFALDGVGSPISALGPAPYPGLAFSPPTAGAPSAGQLHWRDEAQGYSMTLADAAEIEEAWPGVMSGDGWERAVEIRLP